MQVYLLRHGVAVEASAGNSDQNRALTGEGRKKLRQVLQNAAKVQVQPALILSSPLKRAVQTAEIAKEVLGYKKDIVETGALKPGSSVEQVWEEIRVHRQHTPLLLVGHNPLLENLAGYLLGSRNLKMDFKKGAILRLDIQSFGVEPKGVLRWYLTAKIADTRS